MKKRKQQPPSRSCKASATTGVHLKRRQWTAALRKEVAVLTEEANGYPMPEFVRPLWEAMGCPPGVTLPDLVAPLFEKAEGVLEDVLAYEERKKRRALAGLPPEEGDEEDEADSCEWEDLVGGQA